MWIGFRAQLRKPFYADSMWFFLWTFLWVTVHEYWQILKTWWTHESIIWTSICLCHEAKGKIYLTYIQHRSNAAPCQTAKILLTPHAQANLLPISLLLKSPKLTGEWVLSHPRTGIFWEYPVGPALIFIHQNSWPQCCISEPCTWNLWRRSSEAGSQAWVCSWDYSQHIIFFSQRHGPDSPSCLTLSWVWPHCQGHYIKSG